MGFLRWLKRGCIWSIEPDFPTSCKSAQWRNTLYHFWMPIKWILSSPKKRGKTDHKLVFYLHWCQIYSLTWENRGLKINVDGLRSNNYGENKRNYTLVEIGVVIPGFNNIYFLRKQTQKGKQTILVKAEVW